MISFETTAELINISMSSDEVVTLTASLKALESTRNNERQDFRSKIQALNETVSALKSKNYNLDKECSEVRHQFSLLQTEITSYTVEIEDLKNTVQRLESTNQELKGQGSSIAGNLQSITIQRDEAITRFESSCTQLESLKQQYRSLQARHREEIQQYKDSEAQLTHEVEELNQQLRQKTSIILGYDTEKNKSESILKNEIAANTKVISNMSIELEKRLQENHAIRQDKEKLQEEKFQYEKVVNELKIMLQRHEETFKTTINHDRNQNQMEYNKLKGQKEELDQLRQELERRVEKLEKDLRASQVICEQQVVVVSQHEEKERELEKVMQAYHHEHAKFQKDIELLTQDNALLKQKRERVDPQSVCHSGIINVCVCLSCVVNIIVRLN